MITTVVPMDDELAKLGRCWLCKQPFETDDFYCQLTPPCVEGGTLMVWVTCLGCAAQLACSTQTPPAAPDAG